jgi:DNA polymerase I
MIYLVTNQKTLFENENYKVIGVEESLRLLDPLTIVGLDTETQGFSPFLKKLLLLQLGNRDFQVVIDCTTIDVTLYKEYLESDRLFLGWNLKFDVKFLFYHGIVPKNLYDGFIAEKMRWLGYPSGMHSLSLKSAGENYLGIELDKSVRGEIIWRKELTDEIIIYSANDVKYLEDIRDKQLEILLPRGQKLALEVENKAILPTAYFEFCGVTIDVEKWKAKMVKDQEALNKAKEELDNYVVEMYKKDKKLSKFIKMVEPDLFGFVKAGPACAINWNSSRQVIPFLESLGFKLEVRDKATGNTKKSVDATVIEGQKGVHPIAKVYLEFKAAQKVTSTYGQNFLDLINPVTGRLHTSFNQIGTDTHRYSSGGGDDKEVIPGKKVPLVNLQNLPADAETRACFVAEKGNKWISADYSGEESVILANIARDKAMIDLFTNGCGDLHSLVAKMVYPEELHDIPVEQVKKLRPDLRKKAKAPEFTFAYGGDANTLMNRDHLPKEEAEQIEANYRKGFRGVAAYQAHQRKVVMQLGYINTCPEVGYRAYIYDYDTLKETQDKFCKEFWDKYRVLKVNDPANPIVEEVRHYFQRKSTSERQSINYPIQSRGSAIFKICAVNLFNWVVKEGLFGKVKFCIPAHDEFNIEAPEEIAERVADKLYECMVKAGKFICKIVPLDAEVSRLKDGTLPTYWIH